MIELPYIDITFKELADNLIARSERGTAILIVKDATKEGGAIELIRNEREAFERKAYYTAENYQRIMDVLCFEPFELYVVKYNSPQTMVQVLDLISHNIFSGWITTVGTVEDYQAIVNFVKEQRINHRSFKAVVAKVKADDRNIVNFTNEEVVFKDKRGKQATAEYLPSIVGILAKCNVERGATNVICKNLVSVKETANERDSVNAGEFILKNEFKDVRVVLGVNSMTTIDKDKGETEDMKYIEVAETMDLIADDIRRTFKEEYQGKSKNSLDYQIILISAINTYFKALASNGILDGDFENKADIDIAAQRKAWSKIRPEAEFWDDEKVKRMSFKRNVFLSAKIKILNSMDSMDLCISLF